MSPQSPSSVMGLSFIVEQSALFCPSGASGAPLGKGLSKRNRRVREPLPTRRRRPPPYVLPTERNLICALVIENQGVVLQGEVPLHGGDLMVIDAPDCVQLALEG